MLAQGVVLLSIGLPCIALGIYYRKTAKAEREKVTKAEEKKKGKGSKKSQKSKKGKKEKGKDQRGKERGTSGGLSLILGGLAFSAFGIGLIVKAVMGE